MNYAFVASAFQNRFASSHVILYVGQNVTDADLKEWIAPYPWSCVITSRQDAEFAALFAKDGRAIFQYTSRANIPAKPLSRESLPILRLCGLRGDKEKDETLSWLVFSQEQEGPKFDQDLVNFIPELLDYVNPLIIIGADSEEDWKLVGSGFARLLHEYASDGTVSVWDMPSSDEESKNPEAYRILEKLAAAKHFDFYKEPLVNMLKSQKSNLDSAFYESSISSLDNESDVYYQGQEAVSITQRDLLIFKNVGALLTEKTIYRIRPLGRVMSQKWFLNFLENSASMGPQWYGYLPQSLFYVKRSFEDALVTLVRRMLDGRGVMGGSTADRPIILAGDPGSSKSITLAALAYRIYNEKINPVIFISKDSYLGANIGTSFDELDEAMQLLERKAEKETRILVIWDSSAFRAGVEQAQNLLKQLQNRGRRFVLVCSSYSIYGMESEEENKYFCCERDAEKNSSYFAPCEAENAQVVDSRGCYYVRAIRQIDDREVYEFWKRVKDYSGINDTTISQLKQRLKDADTQEIFEYYHVVISLLRENLEQGLRSEQSKVFPYIEKELKKAIGEISASSSRGKSHSAIYHALVAAGYDVSSLPEKLESAVDLSGDDLEKKLDIFNTCVALFSRFKLSVPYSIAYTVLIGENNGSLYSEEGQRLYRIVTRDIPWIYFGEDETGEYSFRFRNSLEAEIFLRNHDSNGEKQVELLCQIIDIYGQGYRKSRCMDLGFTQSLQALLRLVGPNSNYPPFETTKQYEHQLILSKLDRLIDKLKSLKDDYGVPDEDAGFANIIVTFTREFYGSLWTKRFCDQNSMERPWDQDSEHFSVDSYEERITRLSDAIAIAQDNIESIELSDFGRNISIYERQHFINQRDSLVVEMAQCNMRLEDLIDEYKACCEAKGVRFDKDIVNRKLEFRILYNQLFQVITHNPTNGYAYNAIFNAFIKMYNRANLPESKKLQHLSEIMQVVETCETLDSEISSRGSRGTDEISRHINEIKDISVNFKLDLSTIVAHRKGEEPEDEQQRVCVELYDEMLAANNAAAITFICQKELRYPRGTKKLDSGMLERCRRVYEFMMEPDNYECVCANAYALAMLIRVCWMLFNGTTLTSSPECQMTYCSLQQWSEINKLCVQYCGIAGEYKDPLIVLLYALSELQLSGLNETGFQTAIHVLNTLDENAFYQSRLRTPFMVCDETGNPVKFTGTVIASEEKGGFIQVNNVPRQLGGKYGIRFRRYSIGRKKEMPSVHEFLTNLELGIGFTTFSVYTEEGRRDKEVRR